MSVELVPPTYWEAKDDLCGWNIILIMIEVEGFNILTYIIKKLNILIYVIHFIKFELLYIF